MTNAAEQAATPEDRFFISDSLRIHYLDWGGEGRQPLLLLHGISRVAHNFDHVAGHFTPHYHVIAPDLRGHGEIRAWLDARPETVLTIHQSSPPLVEVAGPGRATGISTVTVYRHEAASLPFPRPLTFGGLCWIPFQGFRVDSRLSLRDLRHF